MSEILDLINNIDSGNNVESEKIFNSIIMNKISDSMDNMRTEIAKDMFAENVERDTEEDNQELEDILESLQLDETSKKTMGSYIKKASVDAADRGVTFGKKKATSDEIDRYTNRNGDDVDQSKKSEWVKAIVGADDKSINKVRHKTHQRTKGISRATDRLTKEDIQEDEMNQVFELFNLDEISKKTMGSYIKKASSQRSRDDYVIGDATPRSISKPWPKGLLHKLINRSEKRGAGIKKAVDKLTKEEIGIEDYSLEDLEDFMVSEEFEQLDEISKKTLGSYIKKASVDAADHVYVHSRNRALGTLPKGDDDEDKDIKKAFKRINGIEKATNKITKEEIESPKVDQAAINKFYTDNR